MINQNQDDYHYRGFKLFSIWCGAVEFALGCWFVIILGLFSLKDFVEYLITII